MPKMKLSRNELKNIDPANAVIPGRSIFELPEKVLQFGTGVLLRALPDYFIDKANRAGIFNGRIVVLKSTPGRFIAFQKPGRIVHLMYPGNSRRSGNKGKPH